MLVLLIGHIIISAACLWSGYLFYRYILGNNKPRQIFYYLTGGLIFLTMVVQLLVLFIPVNFITQIIIGIVLAATAVMKRKAFVRLLGEVSRELHSGSWLPPVLFIVTWMVILTINSGPVRMDDTDSYHIQMVKWIEEYGSVPGLVNLHRRFGFNSSWFSSIALFSFSKNTGYTLLNGVISLWLSFWFISKVNQLQKNNLLSAAVAVLSLFAITLFFWPLTRGNAATANYDFITTGLVFVLFTEIILSDSDEKTGWEWIIWPVYLFTVRMLNFPILLLSLVALIYFIRQKHIRKLVLSLVLCLLLISPFLARNVILSGYLFYPSTILDWFAVNWKADPQMISELMEYIKYYNRVSTGYLDLEQTKALGVAWPTTWFEHLFYYDKILVLAGTVGILCSAFILILRPAQMRNNTKLIFLILFGWIIMWFIISPDPRFIYGCLLTGVFLLVYYLQQIIKSKKYQSTTIRIFLPVLTVALLFFLVSKPVIQKNNLHWISPSMLAQPPVEEVTIDGIDFKIPHPVNDNWNARCYGTPLPCLYKIDPRLRLRGNKIQDGFYFIK